MRPSLTSVAVAFCVVSQGCSDSSTPRRPTHATRAATTDVVSVVNGKPIDKAAVQALMRRSGWTASQALKSLQDELLLADSAGASGYGGADAVRRVRQQLLVQALLERDIERSTRPADISDAEVEQAYRSQSSRFSKKETRLAVHVLARADGSDTGQSQTARSFVQGVIADLKRSPDIAKALAGYQGLQGYPFKIDVERLPPIDKDSPVLEPFKDALFKMKSPGVFPQPVNTTYGWHAIYLYDIQPASTVPLKEAASTLREEIALRQRKTRLQTLLAGLKKAHSIRVFESVIRDVLRSDLLDNAAGS